MDVDKLLNLERRSGVKNSEIDDFERKVTDVEAAIKGLVAGTLKPEDVHVEGIETEEEKAKKEKEREERRLILQEKERKLKEERKKEERERWWAGVEIFKPKQTDEAITTASIPTDEEIDKKTLILNRYTVDYSRWNDWTPTDEVTITEMKEIQQREEDEKNKEFEKNNSEFCNQFINDMNERKKKTEKKQESSDISRLKGNRCFKAKSFEKALDYYMEALKDSPFDTKTVNNIAQVYIKTKDYEEALEFLTRTLYLEPSNIKALSRTAFVYSEKGDIQQAVAAIKKALLLEPTNPDLLTQSKELSIIEKERMAEREAIGKFGTSQNNTTSTTINDSTTTVTTTTAAIENTTTSIDNISVQLQSLHSILRNSSSTGTTTGAISVDRLMGFDHNNLTALINAILPQLQTEELLQIYARTSGMLDALLQLTVDLCRVYTTTQQSSSANSSSTIAATLLSCLQLVAHTIHNQRSAILLLLEHKLITAIKPLQLAALPSNLPLTHAISHIYYNSCLNNIASKVRTIILNDKEIIQNSIEIINTISYHINSENTTITNMEFNILVLNTKILHFIVFNEEKERNHSILVQLNSTVLIKFISSLACALNMALYYTKQASTTTAAGATTTSAALLSPSEYVELLVEVAVGSSQIEGLRGLFAQKLPVSENPVNHSSYSSSLCHILLNTLDTYSYLAINIIAILMNICLENTNTIKKEILSHQKGLTLATAQLNYTSKQRQKEDTMLLVRKAGLLARLVSEKTVQDYLLNVNNYKLLCERLTVSKEDAQLDKCFYDECAHYIRILASLTFPSTASAAEPYIRIGKECGVLEALLRVFPTPREDGGQVTPTSVTLMPADLPPALLLGNAARCLMPYADHPSSVTVLYTDKKLLGIEKFICAMASCTDMRVRKNIAILLAKGCKIPHVREKITYLRGMQMMIELQKDL